MMTRIPPGVRAVFFDAVGTLIHPVPSAGAVYAEVGRQYGSRLDAALVNERFAKAFREEDARDARNEHRTGEAREYDRWQAIVSAVLDDVLDSEGCFRALYDHFARPSSWCVESAASEVLRALQDAGHVVGVASNFDYRLRAVLEGLPELPTLSHVLVSSEVGWKKPSADFFCRLAEATGYTPSEILFVGDDEANDFVGARDAGLAALLLDPTARSGLPATDRIASLQDLLA